MSRPNLSVTLFKWSLENVYNAMIPLFMNIVTNLIEISRKTSNISVSFFVLVSKF